jgi:hypothetical protein
MFASVVRGCGSAFVVVDALDECTPDTRRELIEILKSEPGIQLLITSRYLGDIKEILGDAYRVDVLASKEDLRSYAQVCIERYPLLQTQLGSVLDEEREGYLDKIAHRAAGMSVLLLPSEQFCSPIPKGFLWLNIWLTPGQRPLDSLELGLPHCHISPERWTYSTVGSWRGYFINQVRMQH